MWPFDFLRRRRDQNERAIVDALALHGEMSGFMLRERLGIWPGTLYPALARLEESGRLVSRWGVATPERGGKRPRIYSLSAPACRGQGTSEASPVSS